MGSNDEARASASLPEFLLDAVLPQKPWCGAASTAGMVGDELVEAYIHMEAWLREREPQVKAVEAAMAALEDRIVDHFVSIGRQNETRGGFTIYVRTDYWPAFDRVSEDEDDASARARVIEALKGHPSTAALVGENYNANSLRSVVLRDFARAADGTPIVPDHLKGALKVVEKVKLGVTKA